MSFGRLGVALSLVFGCLLLGVIAQLYYFIWWKKKRTNLEIQMDSSNFAKGLFNWRCLKKLFSIHATNTLENVTKDQEITSQEQDLELGTSKDLLLKSSFEEDSVESELMRLHNVSGPPRFLFTIKEETKEDLESEDGRSRKGSRTLSDFFDTPFLTPLASSPLKCPLDPFDSYKNQGFNFNPLFESLAESEFNRFRSSPPPKFKFLRDAEEKLYRKLIEETRRNGLENQVQVSSNETKVTETSDGSFYRIIQNKETQRKQLQQFLIPQFPSSSSQVLPLASSPTTFRPLEKA